MEKTRSSRDPVVYPLFPCGDRDGARPCCKLLGEETGKRCI